MNTPSRLPNFSALLNSPPQAIAVLEGSRAYPDIRGIVHFYQTKYGVLIGAKVSGLPSPQGECASPIFAFHLHEGDTCTGNDSDPFANAGTHFNPKNCPHPYHAGDFPPLFGAHGLAFGAALSDRFTLNQVIGKTVILHGTLDDFTSQPVGQSGPKIACGVIRRT